MNKYALSRTVVFFGILVASFPSYSQDNSPYSRYGLGDMVPNRQIAARGMGGLSAAFGDHQNINPVNPASLSYLRNTVFDLAAEVDVHVLKSNTSTDKYKSNNLVISYLYFGFPVTTKKMQKKGNAIGFSFGLRPVTRVSYKIEKLGRIDGVDSARTIYKGTGGLNQVYLGTGMKIGRFRAGVLGGFNFGNTNYMTRLNLINDSVYYYKSNTQTQTTFNGWSVSGGLIYEQPIGTKSGIRVGLYGTVSQDLSASKSLLNETYTFDGDAGFFGLDTISYASGIKGKIVMPHNYGGGITWINDHWVIGADFEKTNWSRYRNYGQTDDVQDAWKFRIGMQYFPAGDNTPTSRYFQFVKYRAGFYYGPDYVRVDRDRNDFAVTAGASFPLTSFQLLRRGEFVYLNTAVEVGSRGDKESPSFKENMFRFCFGISMSARWFQRVKYY